MLDVISNSDMKIIISRKVNKVLRQRVGDQIGFSMFEFPTKLISHLSSCFLEIKTTTSTMETMKKSNEQQISICESIERRKLQIMTRKSMEMNVNICYT